MPRDTKPTALHEGQRMMVICNACRYCEGYCAVFPAMERTPDFSEAKLHYLANLCHNCAECYYACQYAPPHEFAVNVPRMFAEVRAQSYRRYAWPHWYTGRVLPVLAICLIAFVGATWGRTGSGGDFYGIVPHSSMVAIFGIAAALVVAMFAVGLARFWHESGEGFRKLLQPVAVLAAFRDALTLKYLDSGGHGCTYPDETHSQARRWYHHCTFYGFVLCFASTSVAAIYHYALGLRAPYALLSAPVILGTVGGIGLLIGPLGLYGLKRRRDPAIAEPGQDGADHSLLALLFFTSLTGLLLLALRDTPAMAPLLAIHLAVVLALFVTMPYGKFVHGMYRVAALMRYALEAASSAVRERR